MKITWVATIIDSNGHKAFLGVSKREDDFVVLSKDIDNSIHLVNAMDKNYEQSLDSIDMMYGDSIPWKLEWLDVPKVENFDHIPYNENPTI